MIREFLDGDSSAFLCNFSKSVMAEESIVPTPGCVARGAGNEIRQPFDGASK